jgi:hypothetical protein
VPSLTLGNCFIPTSIVIQYVSNVPCEKESVGEAVPQNKAGDTHQCAKGVGRSSNHLFWLSMFMRALVADLDTLLPECALVAKRQRL